ncbi:MAG: hypothetical protein PWP23_1369 [Candidatus Sumerlaeota bacterium]|nr:hypothetical protein [Candidatus Sumerlaeota bacterium]
MKKGFVLAAAVSMLAASQSFAALSAGDIAFVSYNADGDDTFSFIALVDIPGSEEIKFTDNGWYSAGSFRANEGIKTWTAPAGGVAAETIVTINATANTASAGTVASSGSMAISTSGDQILAYQGLEASPTFITAINNEGAGVWQSDATSSNTSALPTGLTDGTNAIAIDEADNAAYTGATSFANAAAARAAINDSANWTGDNSANQTPPASISLPVELDSFQID